MRTTLIWVCRALVLGAVFYGCILRRDAVMFQGWSCLSLGLVGLGLYLDARRAAAEGDAQPAPSRQG